VKISEFYSPQPSVKFEKLGDCVDGPVVEQPELAPDKYSPGDQVLVLVIHDGDDVTKRLYARKQLLGAIAQAVADAGVDEIECGGRLRVTYTADKPTGAGSSPMKVYEAEYTPPVPVGTAVLGVDDTSDPWG
jgi:hypothetical protein